MLRRKKRSRKSGRRSRRDSSASLVMSRGIVTVAICAGASMWGYAVVNLAT